MVDLAKVLYHNALVGLVYWDATRSAANFEYEPSFLRTGFELAPLTMPLQAGRVYSFSELNRETFKGLPGLLADSLPDKFGNALIDEWLARQGRNPGSYNSVERLCYQGVRSMGALTFEPAEKQIANTASRLEVDSLVEATQRALRQRGSLRAKVAADDKAMLAVLKVGSSAGGARAKAVVGWNAKTNEIRSGQGDLPKGFSHWILKLDGVNTQPTGASKHYGRMEYAYARMAEACGIEMSECHLMEENERAHFMTKRFDRDGNEKIHMQTLCGIAHMDFRMPSAYSYEQVFQTMRSLHLPFPQAEQMYRRMLFNLVARNQDDHVKNISFLMNAHGGWKLAPAYDLTFCYNPMGAYTSAHQLRANGKVDNFTKTDLVHVASTISLKKPMAILEQVLDGVSQWPTFAKQVGIPKAQIMRIQNLHRLKWEV